MALAQPQILVPDTSAVSTLQLLTVGAPGHSDCRGPVLEIFLDEATSAWFMKTELMVQMVISAESLWVRIKGRAGTGDIYSRGLLQTSLTGRLS